MNAVILLFLLGVLLLAGEVFMPGAVLGIVGAIAMTVGCVVSFVQFGAWGGALATGLAAILLGAMLYLELVWLPRSRLGKNMVVQSTSGTISQPAVADLQAVVGKTAEAITTLAPSGYVRVDGRRYEAFSQSGHTAKGAKLSVVGADNFRLIVTNIQS